ncbi:MAG TPA: inhibitor of sigma-G Gin [Peptococcaceae bacterium]|nr:inhibitor of sigma-G Gin [Peptococcaceae bacterium]
MICEQTPPRGIAGGIVVSGCFLCTGCEKEIVETRVGDSRYCDIKEKIKRIWHHGVP